MMTQKNCKIYRTKIVIKNYTFLLNETDMKMINNRGPFKLHYTPHSVTIMMMNKNKLKIKINVNK